MSTAAIFDRTLRHQLSHHAAWLPLVTAFSLGDYGYFDGGVFRSVGNVADFGVKFQTVTGGSTQLNYVTSAGTSVDYHLDGQGTVTTLPETNASATIQYSFKRKRSFILKAPTIVSTRIENLAEVVAGVQHNVEHGWDHRYKLVTELLTAKGATFLATSSHDTKISLSGSASVLRNFHLGNATDPSQVQVESDKSLSLQLVGKQGPCALGLIRLRHHRKTGLQPASGHYDPVPATVEADPQDDH
ncbi:MAG: hypothetical protein K0V04_16360 [Deltaproteobacteria bacterium]|nr:hypothetical protein [Deltaproteobacteria bacterium]